MLTVELPMDNIPKEVLERVSPETLKVLMLINPAFLLIIALLLGTALYDKVGLKVPSISNLLKIESSEITFFMQLKSGILFGLIAGTLITLVALIFQSSIPQEFVDIASQIKVTPFARFAYGGLTEELLMRFGFMTLMVFIVFKISKSLNPSTYWIGIVLAALLFAIGHLPVVFSAVEHPTLALLTYIIVGNSLAGLFFGWLYWKKGLEAAFIAHMFAHVAMMAGEMIFGLKG